MRSDQVLQDLTGSDEVPEDLTRSPEASRDDHDKTELQAQVHELEAENLQLRIDVGVRRELVAHAKTEMDALRGSVEQILKENGALEFQLRQLAPPSAARAEIEPSQSMETEVDNEGGERAGLDAHFWCHVGSKKHVEVLSHQKAYVVHATGLGCLSIWTRTKRSVGLP